MRFLTFLLLALGSLISISFCSESTYGDCIKTERQALLEFKHDLMDAQNRLASWNISSDGNCCRWGGVICDNFTGHVLELNLPHHPFDYLATSSHMNSMLSGKINPSLTALKHLNHLDLSGNNFGGIQVPEFVGSLHNLRHLNLSFAGFSGMVPYQLGNLSRLRSLDLKSNTGLVLVDNSKWLSGLTSLTYLDLSGVNLKKAVDLLLVTNTIPFLKVLLLSSCELHLILPPSSVNFSSLSTLDLSSNQFANLLVPSFVFDLERLVFLDLHGNNFQGSIPDGLRNLTSLRHLNLSHNEFTSSIPNWLYHFHLLEYLSVGYNSLQGTFSPDVGNLTSIKWLDLSANNFEGKIPSSFGKLCKLKELYLFSNKLVQDVSEILHFLSGCVSDEIRLLHLCTNQISGRLGHEISKFRNLIGLLLCGNLISGPIPLYLGNLSSLEFLDLSFNRLSGAVSEAHFVNLRKLLLFDATQTSLKFQVSPNWVPPFQLEFLGLSSCNIGSPFPSWLQSQKSLVYLDISNTQIFNSIPSVFWKTFSEVKYLNLSGNHIHGKLPNLLEVAPQLELLDLSSNNLSGHVPVVSSNILLLHLYDNSFSGSISPFVLCGQGNRKKSIQILNLRNNNLSGELSDCWTNLPNLIYLNLANNRFSGNLPNSLGALIHLKSLHLRNNDFSGNLPLSLKECTGLVTLDVSGNKLSGYVPSWIGKIFSDLVILSLRSNKFYGFLSEDLCALASLQILDLASNNLSGFIPKCADNLSTMVRMNNSGVNYIPYVLWLFFPKGVYTDRVYIEDVSLLVKGNFVEYGMTLNLVRYVDLSDNKLCGEIPAEVASLRALQSINLSHNSLSGRIPESIGAMTMLETIDFSTNKLSGEIPQSIARLTFLSNLNLSYNNLTGKIPSSTQLQGFNASSFVGNNLCGDPLSESCAKIIRKSGRQADDEDKDGVIDFWFYVSVILGFIIGFWGLIGSLVVIRKWRYMYFHFLDHLLINRCVHFSRKYL